MVSLINIYSFGSKPGVNENIDMWFQHFFLVNLTYFPNLLEYVIIKLLFKISEQNQLFKSCP